MAKECIKMTEDDFYAQFTCVKNHIDLNAGFDGCMFETYGPELEHVKGRLDDDVTRRTVWTIIEVEGKFYYVSGYHFVNRFGYLITEEFIKEDLEIEVAINTEVDEIPEAQFSEEITVIDPLTKGEVQLSVFKHPNGGMFAMDSSYLEQEFEDDVEPLIPDPFSKDDNSVIILKGV